MSNLMPSTTDKVRLSAVVEQKIVQVVGMLKLKKMDGEITSFIERQIVIVREMHHRYKSNDFRHSRVELEAEQTVCKWLVEMWHKIHGTSQVSPLPEWFGKVGVVPGDLN